MNLEEMNDDQILEEAKKQGYNENFEGENKKTPKEFLEIGLSHNHVLKERNEKLSGQVEELTGQLGQVKSNMEKLVQFQEEQKKKAVEKALRELNAQKKEAISEGDVEKVEEIDKEIKEHENVAESKDNAILNTWMENNPWYTEDPLMGVVADRIFDQFAAAGRYSNDEAGYKSALKAVEEKIKETYPEKFRNPNKDKPADVAGSRPSPERSTKKTYADLPEEAKAACDQFVTDKIMTREDYVKAYEWE